jgi:hypothetical protein
MDTNCIISLRESVLLSIALHHYILHTSFHLDIVDFFLQKNDISLHVYLTMSSSAVYQIAALSYRNNMTELRKISTAQKHKLGGKLG